MSELEKRIAATQKFFDVDGWELSSDSDHFYHCGIDGGQYIDQSVIKLEPNDIMPIAFDNKMKIVPLLNGDWRVRTFNYGKSGRESTNHDPLIAIVDCFLMMEIE